MKNLLNSIIPKKKNDHKIIDFPVKDIKDLILGTDGKYKMLLRVNPLNGELMNFKELEMVKNAIFQALNPLRQEPFAIYVINSVIDPSKNIENIEEKKKFAEGMKYSILDNQINTFQDIRERKSQKPEFYIVIQSSQKNYNKALVELNDLYSSIFIELSTGGHYCVCLKENEVKKTLYNITHKSSSIHQQYVDNWGLHEVFPNSTTKSKDGKHVVIDDYYYRSFYLASFPKEAEKYRWLKKLLDIKGDYHIAFIFTPKRRDRNYEARLSLQSKLNKSNTKNNKNIVDQKKAGSKTDTYERFADIIADGEQWIYDTSVTITLGNEDKEELTNVCNKFKRSVSKFKATPITFYNFKPYYMSLPILYCPDSLTRKLSWNFSVDDIASMCIFDSPEYMEEKGILYGKNVIPLGTKIKEMGLLIVNRQNRIFYDNGHLCIIGLSGSGKTVFLMAVALNSYPYYDYNIMADLKGDFYFPFGKRYDFSREGNTCINPLHIYNAHGLNSDEVHEAVSNKISDFIAFQKWDIPNLNKYEENIIDEDLLDTYEAVGFYRDRKIPILENFDNILAKKINDDSKSLKEKETRQNIRVYLRDKVRGRNAYLFNGNNTFEFNDFSVFGLNCIKNKETRSCVFDLLSRDVNNFIRSFGTNSGKTFHLSYDEIHNIVNKRNLQATEFLAQTLLKEIRGFGCDVTTSTQELQDMTKVEGGESIWVNSNFKAVLKVSEADVELLNKYYKLTENERKLIEADEKSIQEMKDNPLNFKNKGKGLFFISRNRFGFHRTLDKFEMEIIIPHVYEMLYNERSKYQREKVII